MKLAVLVIGDGRREFLGQALCSVSECVTYPISARLMINDCEADEYADELVFAFPEWTIANTRRRGMAGAVQAGFDLCLAHDPDYVLWIEEDMVLTRTLPIGQAIEVLDAHPELAQMCFKREPFDPSEGDDQLAAICNLAPNHGAKADYTWHDFLFSMNPCLIPKRILGLGWPAGPLGVGNESGMTTKLLERGYVFGSWGHVGDEPWCRHIGVARSAQWRL